ncbi:hypothetical protein HETIRDRAFT_326537 [Heterobasidion irregulare TC 32-1]|uniref:C2 domain-containing protein n=1 Tax=Heterobasidion irregulare (strain TC 32-1) TaxID=747525 RepID=W4JUG1_HETIT|nr:uncharacterized protein HETIRDRAFT_326537 [Heterobasidion irregulare TC 32-1]ETW77187.1 hypothetical protein HETIRDRAFT_326537 [Heterobasidion irregulare TC 32-1]
MAESTSGLIASTVVRATSLPKVDSLDCSRPRNGKFYCVVTIGEERQETKVARRSSTPEWNQIFSFDAHRDFTLKIEIFARRKMRKDQHIGFFSEPISVICPSIFEAGPEDVTKTISGEPGAYIVLRFETKFDIDFVRESPANETLPTIPNSLASQDLPQEVPTDPIPEKMPLERRLSQMHSLHRPVSTLIESASPVSSEASSFGTTWGPLFDDIKIFCEFTDKLAEVCADFAPPNVRTLTYYCVSLNSSDRYRGDAESILVAKIIQKQMERDINILKLFDRMKSFYSIVNDLKTEFEDKPEEAITLQDLFKRIARQTTERYYFISEYANTEGFLKRTGKNALSPTDETITKFCDAFIELRKEFDTGVAVQTGIVAKSILDKVEYILNDVERILGDTDKIKINIDLKEIRYVPEASFDKNKGCQPGTRTVILDEISACINAEDAPRVLLLSGAAGTGKSAITHTIAHQFKSLNRLGSSFCFVRGEAGRGPERLFAHVARDLADLDECIRRTLWRIVQGDTALRTTLHINKQFSNFILKPLKELTLTGPLVIVIDALNESGDIQSRQELLQLLVEKITDFPSNVRMLLTSRPETDVGRLFKPNAHMILKRMQDTPPQLTELDITTYIHNRLSGPGYSARRSTLVSKCEGLFQWASVACTFIIGLGITGLEPLDRYNLLIEGKVHETAGLDGIYTTVLSYLFPIQRSVALDKFIMGGFQTIMALVLTTGRYYVDTSRTHRDLALASLHIMEKELVFNICHLESSYILNKDILDLADRVQNSIPAHLSYSCRFWATHLQTIETGVASDLKLLKGVEVVLKEKILFWLEVMSLVGAISGAARAVAPILKCKSGPHTRQIFKLAMDARGFMNVFGFPISQSTPHIYLSALAFAPQISGVFERFGKDFLQILKVSAGAGDYWPAAQHSIRAGCWVQCVAISPGGLWIVAGLNDSTIRMWDVSTGEAVGDPLEGHRDRVKSVAFSIDGKWIVSGSSDSTIRMWDAATHAAMGAPLEGRTGPVCAVATSPDGTRIVSGSWPNTIRVWDVATCAPVCDPLEGHTAMITSVIFFAGWEADLEDPLKGHSKSANSVAFFPDGSRIVSGSRDRTIRAWNVATWAAVGEPLKGHTEQVTSVVFSPDGKRIMSGSWDKTIRVWDAATHGLVDGSRIVSGSWDKTIRVWDTATRAAVGEVLDVHTEFVKSVAFSPDGRQMVSGSGDRTIGVWDVASCTAVSDPLEAHTGAVNSVGFSPDRKWIVSGSCDDTIQLWDAATHAAVGDFLGGHSNAVNSVAFSPDGMRIVSGSYDKTIWVRDTATHAAVGNPLEAKTEILSVAYSPHGKQIVSSSWEATIQVWDALFVSTKADDGPLTQQSELSDVSAREFKRCHCGSMSVPPDQNFSQS